MFCINCGSDILETDRVCPVCGHIIGMSLQGNGQVGENEIAPLEKRVKAFIWDMGIMLLLYFALSIFLWGYAVYVIPFVIIAYFTVTVGGAHSSTWGMASQKLQVVMAKDGGKVNMPTALLRAVLTIIFACTFLFLVRNKEGRRLNDILSSTMVIVSE